MEQSFVRVGGFVILTPDVDKSLETFKSYGITGPWREFYTDTDNVQNVIKDGIPAEGIDARICMCDYGEITLELFQPLDEDSEFYKELAAIGRPFIHHVIMRTKPSFYDVAAQKGIKEHMSAYFPRIDERGRWFGTSEDLGFDVYAWDPHEDGKVKKYPDDYITTGAYDTDK